MVRRMQEGDPVTWYWVLSLGLAVLLTEAVVEILAESALFDPLRQRLGGEDPRQRSDRATLGEILVWCGYCQSFWIGMGFSFLLGLKFPGGHLPWPTWVDWPDWIQALLMGVVVHRLSNLWHDALLAVRRARFQR